MADRVRDDPPEYDPGAEAERIAEEFADAAADLARDEASPYRTMRDEARFDLTPEEYDRAGEAWAEGHYQPGVSDPADGGA